MSRLAQLALNDEGFAFDPCTGDSFVLNETAIFIVKALREGKTVPEIVAALAEAYEVSETDAERDVSDVAERLTSFGLI